MRYQITWYDIKAFYDEIQTENRVCYSNFGKYLKLSGNSLKFRKRPYCYKLSLIKGSDSLFNGSRLQINHPILEQCHHSLSAISFRRVNFLIDAQQAG